MVHAKGPTWRSYDQVLTSLFVNGDQSGYDLSARTGLDPKTVFRVLKCLGKYLKRIPTGERNKVRYHLPSKNYPKAMARYGWRKDRLPIKRLQKLAKQIHQRASDRNARAIRLLDELLLQKKAKEYLLSRGLISELDLIQSIREGFYCMECLNNGDGLYPTHYDQNTGVYVCRKCGMEQEPFPREEPKRRKFKPEEEP